MRVQKQISCGALERRHHAFGAAKIWLGFPVRARFVTYSRTMQETCLRLMGKKMLVALMMEGKFSGEDQLENRRQSYGSRPTR